MKSILYLIPLKPYFEGEEDQDVDDYFAKTDKYEYQCKVCQKTEMTTTAIRTHIGPHFFVLNFWELSHLTRYLSQAEQNAQNDNYFIQNG